jgi:hypothetical protein
MKNPDQVQQPAEESLWFAHLQGNGHTLSIVGIGVKATTISVFPGKFNVLLLEG